jgi:hypothetical protein
MEEKVIVAVALLTKNRTSAVCANHHLGTV